MRNHLQAAALALVFLVLGAFVGSLWLELRHETPTSDQPAPGRWEGGRIRVEVLNGAGIDKLAEQATQRLRELDFDVVYYGNLQPFDHDTSLAIARLDDLEPARRVADALGIQRVVRQTDRNLYLDVTVILGSDWPHLSEDAGAQEEMGSGSLWWQRVKRVAGRLWPG